MDEVNRLNLQTYVIAWLFSKGLFHHLGFITYRCNGDRLVFFLDSTSNSNLVEPAHILGAKKKGLEMQFGRFDNRAK